MVIKFYWIRVALFQIVVFILLSWLNIWSIHCQRAEFMVVGCWLYFRGQEAKQAMVAQNCAPGKMVWM